MRKLKRKAILRDHLEGRLKKNERRMQAISEESYKIRLAIEQMDLQETLKKEKENALHKDGAEGSIVGGSTDRDAGKSNVPDNNAPEAVLGEQPA